MRNEPEIEKEIAALKALKPAPGIWAGKTARSIELMILELEHGYDDTAEEWNELTDEQRDVITQTREWKEDRSDDRPSEGWGKLAL